MIHCDTNNKTPDCGESKPAQPNLLDVDFSD